jgi:hypothetical protein
LGERNVEAADCRRRRRRKAAGGNTAYTLQHSTITDLVDTRSPLLSVAQISGTNAEMIERHYGHLRRTETVETLSKLAL